MSLVNGNLEYTFAVNHALSVLFANRPHLLKTPRIYPGEVPSHHNEHEKQLLSIGRFILNQSSGIEFGCKFSEMDIIDVECMVMAFEVMLEVKNRFHRLNQELSGLPHQVEVITDSCNS